jgi:hypothetical protein
MRARASHFGRLSATLITAHAQQQEQKLLDRLLKPEMSLENSAQGKQFTAGGATIDKQARTKSFYVRDRRAEKQFVTGNFSTKPVPHLVIAVSTAGGECRYTDEDPESRHALPCSGFPRRPRRARKRQGRSRLQTTATRDRFLGAAKARRRSASRIARSRSTKCVSF